MDVSISRLSTFGAPFVHRDSTLYTCRSTDERGVRGLEIWDSPQVCMACGQIVDKREQGPDSEVRTLLSCCADQRLERCLMRAVSSCTWS